MADLILIEQFRAYLIDLGLVRFWGTDPDGSNTDPQCILDPRDGAPEPRGKTYAAAVVTLTKVGQIPKPPLEEFLEEAEIECVTRAYLSQDAELIQRRIRQSIDGLKLFQMGTLTVEWARVFSGDQPVVADETSYTRRQTFRISARVRSLAGTPYWP